MRLRVVDSKKKLSVKEMLVEGLCMTVNSDDPIYFGGYVADNFSALRDALGFSREEFCTVTNVVASRYLCSESFQPDLRRSCSGSRGYRPCLPRVPRDCLARWRTR